MLRNHLQTFSVAQTNGVEEVAKYDVASSSSLVARLVACRLASNPVLWLAVCQKVLVLSNNCYNDV